MARQSLGAPPTRPEDLVDVKWVTSTYPSFSLTVSTDDDYAITLPANPIAHTMYFVEVFAEANITVTIPSNVLLTEGVATYAIVFAGKTAFFGFRYSETVNSWFLLSTTSQV